MKYIITIFNTLNGTTHNLTRDSATGLESLVDKELGGFDNLVSETSTGSNLHDNAFCKAGSTKDGSKLFSILAF